MLDCHLGIHSKWLRWAVSVSLLFTGTRSPRGYANDEAGNEASFTDRLLGYRRRPW